MITSAFILRKLSYLQRQVLRRFVLCDVSAGRGNPLLANSFPKSGTHLLTQILESFPGTVNYLSFLASLPSWRYVERSKRSTIQRIRNFRSGEMISGHLFFKPEYQKVLLERRVLNYFIFRDPRDVACSEAHYLSQMAPFHRLHRAFRNLKSEEAAITMSIVGDYHANVCPVPYQNIAQRFRVYQGWLNNDNVCAVRFEDLIGKDRVVEVTRMCRYFADRTPGPCPKVNDLVTTALKAISPSRSHTFRTGGGVETWRRKFTSRQRSEFKLVAGELLIELGYENGYDW